jgi:hypothetical protein
MPPDSEGQSQGAASVSPYPERDSNPHGPKDPRILSALAWRSRVAGIGPDRVSTETGASDDCARMAPNEDRQSPDPSPDPARCLKRRGGGALTTGLTTAIARIRARVTVDANGCWIWPGAKNSKGYGSIGVRVEGRTKLQSTSVHRVMAMVRYGPIPAEALVCHTCDVRACCNPKHLYVGDHLTNARDAVARGRAINPIAIANAAKTHCPAGHLYDNANTLSRQRGGRRSRNCKRCEYQRAERRRTARRAAS